MYDLQIPSNAHINQAAQEKIDAAVEKLRDGTIPAIERLSIFRAALFHTDQHFTLMLFDRKFAQDMLAPGEFRDIHHRAELALHGVEPIPGLLTTSNRAAEARVGLRETDPATTDETLIRTP